MKGCLRPAALMGFLLFLLLSCKTTPGAEAIPPGEEGAGQDVPLTEEVPPEDEGPAAEGETPVPPDEEASVFLPPGELPAEAAVSLIEPVPDIPETDSPLLPPPEAALSALLPEPSPPELSLPPEPEPEPEPEIPVPASDIPALPPEPETPPPGSASAENPPASSVPPPEVSGGEGGPVPEASPAPPPEPPAFLRSAEPEPSPSISREPIPLPVNPLPELPAGTPAETPARIPEEEIEYSRIVRATVGQLVEIPFQGTGWVYLGELASRQGISYDSRRLDPEGQSFIFRAEKAGTYGLSFYKQDFIRDYILNDHVQVIIGEAPALSGSGWFNPPLDRGRVVAEPRWPSNTGPAPGTAAPGMEPSGAVSTPVPAEGAVSGGPAPDTALPGTGTIPGAASVPAGAVAAPSPAVPERNGEEPAPSAPPRPGMSDDAVAALPPAPSSGSLSQDTAPGEYLRRAREEFDAGRIGSALSVLDQFREAYPAGSDEAWWLYGQLFEANSPNRDIRSALDYYRRLTREYPQSPRYAEARRRIAYLERYYFNIP